jgi:aspartate-semialdehyde dehydrogenase
MKRYNIAIVGATGLVGRTFIKVLHERNFPVGSLSLYASERSAGTVLQFKDTEIVVEKLTKDSFKGKDIALFSAGKNVSSKYAPIAAEQGCVVVDNSSAWRRNESVPLIVPEVNAAECRTHKGILAVPNCNVIPLALPLMAIDTKYKVKRAVVSTYQSISGAGNKGLEQMFAEIRGETNYNRITKHKIAYNAFFHEIEEPYGFSIEEQKLQFEIRKILKLPSLALAATCVRLPTIGGHCLSVNLELAEHFELDDVKELMTGLDGVVVVESPETEDYPTPQLAKDTDLIYIGRLRRDDTVENGLYLWIVADNVRKGAATTAVQIAEIIINDNLFDFMSL